MNAKLLAMAGACLDGCGLAVFGSVLRPAGTPVALNATGPRASLPVPVQRIPTSPARYYDAGSLAGDNLLFDFVAFMPTVLATEHLRRIETTVLAGDTPIHASSGHPSWREMRGTPFDGSLESLAFAYLHLRRSLSTMRRVMSAAGRSEALAFLAAFWSVFERAYRTRGDETPDLAIDHCVVGAAGAFLALGRHRAGLVKPRFQAIDAVRSVDLGATPCRESAGSTSTAGAGICLSAPGGMLREAGDLYLLATGTNPLALCRRLQPEAGSAAFALLGRVARIAGPRRPMRHWTADDPLLGFAAACAGGPDGVVEDRCMAPRAAGAPLLDVVLQPASTRCPELALFATVCTLARRYGARLRYCLLAPEGTATDAIARLAHALQAAGVAVDVSVFPGLRRMAGIRHVLARAPERGTILFAEGCVPTVAPDEGDGTGLMAWIDALIDRRSSDGTITVAPDPRNWAWCPPAEPGDVAADRATARSWRRPSRLDGLFRVAFHVPAGSPFTAALAGNRSASLPFAAAAALEAAMTGGTRTVSRAMPGLELLGLPDAPHVEAPPPECLLAMADFHAAATSEVPLVVPANGAPVERSVA